nr:uncharacterized protein LOC106681103 [Halyomorpha halys]
MIVVFGLFTQIKNDRDNFIQGFGIGGFGIINIFQLYMMCSSAEVLATESERVALAIYDIRWYQMNRSNGEMLRLMLFMAKNPVQVTAFRARTFLLNKESFIGFITSSLTALMTFTKINDIRQSQSSS